MKHLLLALAFLLPLSSFTQDRTESPRFQLDAGGKGFHLVQTGADVRITGMIANVMVQQLYVHDGSTPAQAAYLFPMSTRAAVHGLTFRVGSRRVTAVVQERQAAQATYDAAIAAGKSAALLTEVRPNVMQMNVGNIMPGDTVEVLLAYTELLVPEKGVYEFVYPTVVGPRYRADSLHDEDAFPLQRVGAAGEAPSYRFFLRTEMETGIPATFIESPSHPIEVQGLGGTNSRIVMTDAHGGNRDFVLRYSLRGSEVQAGLLTWQGAEENHFLLVAEPPARVQLDHCPKREFIFVVDVSGSMGGFPLEISKEIMRTLLDTLTPGEYFNILTFAGGAATFQPQPVRATPENIELAHTFMEQAAAGGATNMQPAIQQAMAIPKARGFSRSFIILTDGMVTYDRSTLEMVAEDLDSANFFAFGIGTSVNRYLIEGIAKVGKGLPLVALNPDEGRAKAKTFMEYVAQPVLTDIHLDYGGNEVYDVEPVAHPDLLAERPLVIHGKYKGSLAGTFTLTGTSGTGPWEKRIDLGESAASKGNVALRYLWARERIAARSDFSNFQTNSPFQDEITELGLKYNLLTPYTSFVAVIEEVRNPDGVNDTTQLKVPRPQGVSDMAQLEISSSTMLDPYGNNLLSIAGARAGATTTYIDGVRVSADVISEVCIISTASRIAINTPGVISCRFVTARHYACLPMVRDGLGWNDLFTRYTHRTATHMTKAPLWEGPSARESLALGEWSSNSSHMSSRPAQYTADVAPGTVDHAPSFYLEDNAHMGITLSGSQFGELGGSIYAIHSNDSSPVRARIDVQAGRMGSNLDMNEDGFTDLPGGSSGEVNAFLRYSPRKNTVWNHFSDVSAHAAHDASHWQTIGKEADHWSAERTRRQYALVLSHNIMGGKWNLKFKGMASATSLHAQYGGTAYDGQQRRLWAQVFAERELGRRLLLQTHATYDMDHFDQQWGTATVLRHEQVPAIYAGLRYLPSEKLSASAGSHVQWHNLYGSILSPQAELSVSAFRSRLALGGSLMRFTDPANPMVTWRNLLLTTREVMAPTVTQPDQAWVAGLFSSMALRKLLIRLDANHYAYSQRLLPDLDTDPSQLRWVYAQQVRRNHVSGYATYSFGVPLKVSVMAAWLQDEAQVNGLWRWNYLTPRWILGGSASHTMDALHGKLFLHAGVNWVGQQQLPSGTGERLTTSYPLATAQVDWEKGAWLFSLQCQNLLGIKQPTAVYGSTMPGSTAPMDAGLQWAPIVGQRITGTVKVRLCK